MDFFDRKWQLWLPIWCFLVASKSPINAEIYTAVTELEGLLKTEAMLIKFFETYIAAREEKLKSTRSHIDFHEKEHEKTRKETTEYMANPINIFLLVKRLTLDWRLNDTFLSDDVYQGIVSSLQTTGFKMPTEKDLKGAIRALIRLQETYALNVESLANGELNGVKCSSELSSDDCFEIGRQLYENEHYKPSIPWLREALRKHNPKETSVPRTPKWKILEYLTHSLYIAGKDMQAAYNYTNELLTVSPDHHNTANVPLHHSKTEKVKQDRENNQGRASETQQQEVSDEYSGRHFGRYELLCRKAVHLSTKISSQLKCKYVHKNNPYLLIAPFKEEEAYLEPRIVLYHDVLYSSEIEILKHISMHQLKPALVGNDEFVDTIRSSKLYWLSSWEHPIVPIIRRRVDYMTSLTTETADNLQICNYGLGGHYTPHFDYFESDYKGHIVEKFGNRIATVLFYMTDVVQGGDTVFPELDVALEPKKGAAAFWYNLHSSGDPDTSTLHAACPVVIGSKWVTNLWIHEKGQVFLRPCDVIDASPIDIK